MHELSLVVRMLDLAEEAARAEGALRIDAIHLEVGALSGVVPEALAFAFDGARVGTMAEGARLEVAHVAATAYCSSCARTFEADDRFGIVACPTCDAPSADLLRGRELRMTHLEVT
jgi:hydrogenase nickel incorporation protein HypA/HybF